jgi:hypothetical protein
MFSPFSFPAVTYGMMISFQLMLHAEMRRPRKNQPPPILVPPRRVSTLRLRDFSFPERCRRLSGLSGQHSSLSFRSGLAQSIVTTDIERLTLIYSMTDRSKNEDVRWRQRFQMIENRNETTHTYDEETAAEIADAILSRYVPEFEKFQIQFLELEREETK